MPSFPSLRAENSAERRRLACRRPGRRNVARHRKASSHLAIDRLASQSNASSGSRRNRPRRQSGLSWSAFRRRLFFARACSLQPQPERPAAQQNGGDQEFYAARTVHAGIIQRPAASRKLSIPWGSEWQRATARRHGSALAPRRGAG
jgi:hypothetical protein